ncbi:MAG TPA: flagellar motor protein MotB [Pyrinomonadaceae bacterium]|nr:flagellar motor protein MotB [Pyrinomonadaceae bacterium]
MNQSAPRKHGRSRASDALESRDRWLISYADLVTLLLALFIVLYAAADHQRAVKVATAFGAQFGEEKERGNGVLPGSNSLVTLRARMDQALSANPALENRVRVDVNERGLVVSLTEAGFFAPGNEQIREDALPLLNALAEILRDAAAQVRIEGHTDSLPISTVRHRSNWELSASRATAVLTHLVNDGVPAARLSIAGFADTRPVADNQTPEGRALNRRVDLVVLGQS